MSEYREAKSPPAQPVLKYKFIEGSCDYEHEVKLDAAWSKAGFEPILMAALGKKIVVLMTHP